MTVKPKRMKPVQLWGLIDRHGNLAWGKLRYSRSHARIVRLALGLDSYRIARVEVKEVTK